MGLCNCAVCLKKRKLSHLIPDRFGSIQKDRLPGETVQAYIERVVQQSAPAPFDRVRLVNKADDVRSPPLSEEWQAYIAKQTNPHYVDLRGKEKMRKLRSESAKEGIAKTSVAKTAAATPTTAEQSTSGPAKKLKLKFKRPLAASARPPGRPRGRPKKDHSKEVTGDAEFSFLSSGLTAEDLRHLALECTAQTGEKVVDSDGDTVDGYSDITPYSGPGAPRWDSMSPPRSVTASLTSEGSVNEADAGPVITINDYLARIQPQQPSTASVTPVLGTADLSVSGIVSLDPAEHAEAHLAATVNPEHLPVDDHDSSPQNAASHLEDVVPDQHPFDVDYASSLENIVAVTPEQALMEAAEFQRAASSLERQASNTSRAQLSDESPPDVDMEALPEPSRSSLTTPGQSQTRSSPMRSESNLENDRTSISNEPTSIAFQPPFPVRWGERAQAVETPSHQWAERQAPLPTPPSSALSFDRLSVLGSSEHRRATPLSPSHVASFLSSYPGSPTRRHGDSDVRSRLNPISASMYQRHSAFTQVGYSRRTAVYQYDRQEQSPSAHVSYDGHVVHQYQGSPHSHHEEPIRHDGDLQLDHDLLQAPVHPSAHGHTQHNQPIFPPRQSTYSTRRTHPAQPPH